MNYKLDIVGHRKAYFLVSALLLLVGIVSLLVSGLNLGIDFVSGTRLDVEIKKTFKVEDVQTLLEKQKMTDAQVRAGGNNNTFAIVNVPHALDKNQVDGLTKAFRDAYGKQVNVQAEVVSPVVGRELARNALFATLIALVGIIIYVAIRFEYRFAVAAVLALVHDALFTVGMFSLLQIEVDLTFNAAILTIVGYSVNDTIVIFDRIRENMNGFKLKTFDDLRDLVNVSIQQTLARSINTGLTVLFMAGAIFLFGGESIANFALALLFGLTIGMYSSIFIASQIWVLWKWRSMEKERMQPAKAAAE